MPKITSEPARGVAPDSAFLEGHFPGNPVVPGAIILGYLAERLSEEGLSIKRVVRMKFVRPLVPELPFQLDIDVHDDTARCSVSGTDGVFATAILDVSPRHV